TIDGAVPDPDGLPADARESARRALRYQELVPGTLVRDIAVDAVFIGSCTNARLEDLRLASEVVRRRKVRSGLRALVVPGSMRVKADAEREGLDRKSTRLNSSHVKISYAVFCLKKKKH